MLSRPTVTRPHMNGAGVHLPSGATSHTAALELTPEPMAELTSSTWVDAVARGRREWAGAFGDLAKSRRNWQLAAFGSLAIAGIMSTGLVTLATQARITPYVVEVDKLGRPQAFGRADRLQPADQRIVASQIATWIRDIRAVLADPISQQDLVRRAYAFVDQNTAQFLQAYMTDPTRDPRVIGRELTRVVEVTSILPVPGAASSASHGELSAPRTWRVSWTETDYPRAGGAPSVAAWEAYLTTHQVPPTVADRIEVNPLGLFVTSVSWTQVSARQSTAPLSGVGAAPDSAAAVLPTITSQPLVTDPSVHATQPVPGFPQRRGVTP